MTIRRIITTILVVCFAMTLVLVTPSYAAELEPTNVSWEDKIDAEIWNTSPDENGKYLVYVSRKSVSSDKIEDEFNRRNEFSLSNYQDQVTYRRNVGPTVALVAIEKYGMYNSLQLDYGRELFDDNLAPIEYELINNYSEYIMNKRTVITDLYDEYNQKFVDKFDISSDDVLYVGQYTGSYVLYATREEIETMAKNTFVNYISVWVNDLELNIATTTANGQIGTDSTEGTQSENYNNGSGYKGTGIKIGIIETEKGKYRPEWVMLNTIPESKLQFVPNGTVTGSFSDHASMVTSIIVGQKIETSKGVFEGVVPNATVFQTACIENNVVSFIDAVNLLLDEGVSVINFSGTVTIETGLYNSVVAEIDALICNSGVSFVVAAGNNGNLEQYEQFYGEVFDKIGIPGLGYNVITVGSVDTMNYSKVTHVKTPLAEPYNVSESSSSGEPSYTTNKPDIVAPGANISVLDTMTTYCTESGTSYAAPFVTGVVAQIFQANEALMDSPTKTKAVLLAGADPTKVSNSNNPEAFTGSTLIREKSGVGMVNAENSIYIANHYDYGGTTLYLDTTTTAGKTGQLGLTFLNTTSNSNIRIVLTYDKPDSQYIDESGYPYNARLELYRSTVYGDELVAFSSLQHSNVQVIEFTATQAATYYIKYRVSSFTLNGQPLQWRIAAAWSVD